MESGICISYQEIPGGNWAWPCRYEGLRTDEAIAYLVAAKQRLARLIDGEPVSGVMRLDDEARGVCVVIRPDGGYDLRIKQLRPIEAMVALCEVEAHLSAIWQGIKQPVAIEAA